MDQKDQIGGRVFLGSINTYLGVCETQLPTAGAMVVPADWP